MASHFPPPIHQQKTGLGFPTGLVLGDDVFGLAAPDFTTSVILSKDEALVVTIVIDPHTEETHKGNQGCCFDAQSRSTRRQVKRLTRVDGWHPVETSPANVIPGTIVLNVHTAQVTSFPVEKLADVN